MNRLKKASQQPTLLLLVLVGLSACLEVNPTQDYRSAGQLIEASTGRSEAYDPYGAQLAPEELDVLLSDGLSLDEALRISLLNNRELQAEFLEIGLAHADWVQSRLWSNPSLDVLLRFPTGGGRSLLEAIVGVELLELWRIPARSQVAEAELKATVLRIARRAGERLASTRDDYHRALAKRGAIAYAEERVALARRRLQAVQALREVGAVDALGEERARGPLLAAELELRSARTAWTSALRELAKGLSFERPAEGWRLTDELPQPRAYALDAETHVQQALKLRLDLRAIGAAIEAQGAAQELERKRAWGDLRAGPGVERPAGSESGLIGPEVSVKLPLFDQNQAQEAKAALKLEQLIKLQEAAQVAVSQDVRSAVERANSATDNLRFLHQELLPTTGAALELARQSYRAGRGTLLSVIEVEEQDLLARQSRVELRLEAALALSDLERLVGAPLIDP